MSKLGKTGIKAATIDLIKEKINASDDLKANLGRMSEQALAELHSKIKKLTEPKLRTTGEILKDAASSLKIYMSQFPPENSESERAAYDALNRLISFANKIDGTNKEVVQVDQVMEEINNIADSFKDEQREKEQAAQAQI